MKHGWEKIPNWECLFVHREKGIFLSVYVDDIKLAGKKQNLDPMWKVLNKEVDLGEPTSFLDHVYLGCTQRQCEISKDIVDNYRTMFESRISAGGLEKLPFPQNIRISSWSYDMERRFEKVLPKHGWEKLQTGNVYSLTEKKGYSCLSFWTMSKWLGRNRTLTHCGKYSIKKLIWQNQHHSLTMSLLVALNENVKLAKILWAMTKVCSNHGLPQEPRKNYRAQGNLKRVSLTNKTTQQSHKVATPCLDYHQFEE